MRAALIPAIGLAALGHAQVTTYHYNASRTGANTSETILNTTNVTNNFGKLFSLPVDAEIYAQPLYMPNITVPGQGMHNIVYIATMNNSVYAFDADTGGTPLWQANFGTPMPDSVCCQDRDILVQIGILSTPVIDPNAGIMYLVAETYTNGVTAFTLHAISITTGTDVQPPVVIQGSVAGAASDGNGSVVTFTPINHWQRPALLLANGQIYVAFGSHQDSGPYHGWLFSYSGTTLAQTGIFCVTPNGAEGGIWQGGVGLAADANGNIYLETGNGLFDANTGGADYGDSLLQLSATGLSAVDYFTPSTQAIDAADDWDLGSGGPLLIPGSNLVAAGGKDGKLYIANTTDMGGYNATSDQIFQEWQATYAYAGAVGGFWGGNYIFYNNAMYAFGERDYLKVWPFNGTQFVETPSSTSTFMVPSGFANDPAMSISANGTQPGTGIVWAAFSSAGIADGSVQPGVLYAFDASNVANVLWNSNANSARDSSGDWAKWDPPIVANGKVYLASFDKTVNVYGLLTPQAPVPQLTGSGTTSTATANLTAAGTTDWIQWGDTTLNRKANVTAQLSTYSVVGTAAVAIYGNDPRGLSWSDGTPTASATADVNGVYIAGLQQGFSFTAPAGTTPQTLTVYVGGFTSGGTLTASLSDGSAPNFVATTAPVNGQYDETYTLTYAAASAGQTLTVSWVMSSGTGNVTLNAAALSTSGATSGALGVAVSGGAGQSTAQGTAFAAPLSATVTNALGTPMSGVTVTFTAPATGASATFGGAASATAVTNASGVASSPTLTANATTGSYTVSATAPGAATAASFSLSNTASVGPPVASSITATAGGAQSTTVGMAFATALQVTVLTSGGDPVSGASVTFTAPTTGASASFAGATTTIVMTDASGVATSPTLTANAAAGSYTVSATVAGVSPAATFMLTNTSSTGGGGGGGGGGGSMGLSGVQTSSAATANLTAAGTTDWIQWGDTTLNRKANVTAQLSTYSVVGTAAVAIYGNDPRGLSWSDGTPTASATADVNGVYIAGLQQGFSFTAPAGTTPQTLTVYVGGFTSGGTLTASLSDGSAPNFVATTAPVNGQYDETYTLTYAAASAGQTLTVSWVMSSGTGNVTLNAAALSTSGATSGALGVAVPLSAVDNLDAIATTGTVVTGIGSDGYAYASALLPNPVMYAGASFSLGAPDTLNAVTEKTIPLPAGSFAALSLIGTGIYGSQVNQPFVVTYTDGSTTTFTQSLSDWGHPANFTGETVVASTSYRITPSGATQSGPWALFGYSFTLNAAKVVKSLTLPANAHVVILGAELTGRTALSIMANGGTGQSATQGTAFAQPLSATVTNSTGTPVSGVTVTFTAPATGASAGFAGAASASAVTNASGIATSPTLTANATAGSYTVSATAPGVTTAATFTLTNSAPLSQTITFGTIPGETVGESLTLGATASSGLPVAYTTTTPTLCTIKGSVASFIGVGACSITAAQAGNANYAPATSVTQSVAVAAAPVAGFSMSASPGSVSVVQGQSGGTSVAVNPVNGFAGTVSFSASGLPTGVTASFAPTSATSGTTVTFNAAASATTGLASVKINGTSGAITAVTTVALTVTAAAGTTPATPVPTSAVNNLDAIATTGTVVSGIGSDGYAYASALLPKPVVYAGASFSLGAADTLNAVAAKTIPLPTGSFAALSLLGTGIYGSQVNQRFVVTYTDGSTTTFTQSLSDWGHPANFTGETVVASTSYRITPSGATQSGPWALYGYTFALNSAKVVKSLTLPANGHVVIFGAELTGATPETPSFALTPASASATVTVGSGAVTDTIAVTGFGGFAGSVTFGVTGLPTGATASFSPASSTVGTTLSINAPSSVAAGTYLLTIKGTSTSPAASAVTSVSLTVTAAPKAQTISFATIATQRTGTALALSASASSGLAVSFASSTPSVCTVTGSTASFVQAGTCTIVASQAGNGTYAAAPSITQSFSVTPPSSFTLQPKTSSVTVTPPTCIATFCFGGAAATDTITLTPANGFTGAVIFSVAGLPTGVTAAFVPTTVTTSGSTTLTLTPASTAATGRSTTLTVTGKSSSLSATTTIKLNY